MITESIFEQGTTHEVCEDYAIHGPDYTILADGCSNGGGPRIDTDWGSRILCKAAEDSLGALHDDPKSFMTIVGTIAKTQIHNFANLPTTCLTATLSVLQKQEDKIKGFLVGDGIFGGKRKDGRWKIYVVDFLKGGKTGKSAPFYLKYKFCNEVETYVEQFGGAYEVTTYFGDLMSPKVEFPESPVSQKQREEKWGYMMSVSSQKYELEKGYSTFQFPIDEYEFVFHCSDGPQAFIRYEMTDTSKVKENVHVLDVIRVLMDIRGGAAAGFLRRQRHWAFKQDRPGTLKNRGWFGEDDVAVGVIYCGK